MPVASSPASVTTWTSGSAQQRARLDPFQDWETSAPATHQPPIYSLYSIVNVTLLLILLHEAHILSQSIKTLSTKLHNIIPGTIRVCIQAWGIEERWFEGQEHASHW